MSEKDLAEIAYRLVKFKSFQTLKKVLKLFVISTELENMNLYDESSKIENMGKLKAYRTILNLLDNNRLEIIYNKLMEEINGK